MNVNDLLGSHDFFLTGASGFIGTFLLYKLLLIQKSKQNARKIFVLLRNSKNHKNVEYRLRDEVLNNILFDSLRKEIDTMIGKTLIAVEGDITSPNNFGIGKESMQMLTDKENRLIFVHCAADIQFDRPLNVAMEINVLGSYLCVELAKQCKAAGFLHVSTLYVNSRMDRDSVVKEDLYEKNLDGVAVFDEWRKLNGKFDTKRVNQLLFPGDKMSWPNTYTLTKNIAEKVVIHHCRQAKMPLSITRLGIVSPCYREQPGWFLGNGGFVFVGIGAATGHLRYFNGDGRGRPDLVPVDFTVNEADEWGWDNLFAYIAPRFRAENFAETAPGYVHFIPNKFLFSCVEWVILDLPLMLGRPLEQLLMMLFPNAQDQPKLCRKIAFLRKAREKMLWLNNNYTYFMNGRWKFDHSNVTALFDRLDKNSKKEFDFDAHNISLNKYVCETIIIVMRKWQEHKEMKAKQEKQRQKELLQMNKKDIPHHQIIQVVKKLAVSLGGIGQSDVGYPWLVSLIVTLLLLWLTKYFRFLGNVKKNYSLFKKIWADRIYTFRSKIFAQSNLNELFLIKKQNK
ncbi:hypothetical protein RFI_01185 [Reticulomyxa filosa]|uniref:Fatty acyl-CoA reductase n=1 Tax=Reticulomyxa filosa TaxID=46433 RepID=X6PCI3_RETFI|nr:hypothetical protein RFI_01185 [Reticulomyxa filosa]|eukprot:ETO35876.1 hypothetical protein RFI_01185 [Reticulomyxa filosa]